MTTTDPTRPAEPAREVMVQRNLRVPLGLWDAGKAKAGAETPPRDISTLVRDLLSGYVAD